MNDIDKRLDGLQKQAKQSDIEQGTFSSDTWLTETLTRDDVLWLISTLKSEREEKERLERTLQFYAKPGNNKWEFEGYVWASEVMRDNGEKARQALGGDRE